MAVPATTVPLLITNPLLKVLEPLRVKLPTPVFVNTPPPEMIPEKTGLNPLVSMVPMSVMATFKDVLSPPPPTCNVPLLKIIPFTGLPILALETLRIPPESTSPPVKVLTLVSVRVPLPDLIKAKVPPVPFRKTPM